MGRETEHDRIRPRHPDGMYLSASRSWASGLREACGGKRGARLSPEEAFNAIGAIGLDTAQALASQRGELPRRPARQRWRRAGEH